MAIFTGKIIEAYYTNSDNTTIEIIYKDGDKAISHYMVVDYDHPDFRDLIKEYPVSAIEKSTVERIRRTNNQLRTIVSQSVKNKIKEADLGMDNMLNFILNYNHKTDMEKLFALKIKIFDQDRVKDINNETLKKKIRMATDPIETIRYYHELIK
jgi:hypothetical protein